MQPTVLELCSTRDLVDELMQRKTFLGVIVHSEQEHKGDWHGERMFKVRFTENLSSGEAGRLLERIAEHLEKSES